MLELAPDPVLPIAPSLPVIWIGTKGGPRCIQRTWLLLGEPLGSTVQKEEGKCDDKKGGRRDLEGQWESITCKKQNKTKNTQKFRSLVVINMELDVITIKRTVNCKQVIHTVSGRDPAILLSCWRLLAGLAPCCLSTVLQQSRVPLNTVAHDQMEYQTYTVYNDSYNSS